MSQKKNALDFALQKWGTEETRVEIMTLTHAVLSTAMVESATEAGTAEAKAAEYRCFARAIRLLEEKLGNTYSAVPAIPRTHFVQKSELPKK